MKQLERRRDALERRRHRLGPGGGARVRVAARRRDPDPAHRPGHRARHVLAPPRRPPRRQHRRARSRRSSISTRRRASFEIHNSPLSEYACARLRVRLLGRRAGGARPLGGAVRRLRQRRADHHRPVHLRRAVEVARVDAADAAPAARLRGERAGALERAARAVPPARGAGEHPDRELHDVGAVLPPRCAGRRSTRRRGRSS